MIEISDKQRQEIFQHCKENYPKEACGILLGKKGKVQKVYKMTNTSDDPVDCYFMDPSEQFKVMKEIRQSGGEMLAIFHSHTHSEAYPSERDISLAYYPDTSYLVITLLNKDNPKMKSFKIVDNKISEEEIRIA